MASQVEMLTKHGDPVKLNQVDEDILLPAQFSNIAERLKPIRELGEMERDILLCSYPKSGTHWMAGLIRKILSSNMDEKQLEKYSKPIGGLLELAPLEVFNNMPSPRVIPTHLRPKRIPTYFLEGKAKVVLVLRNPKDVAVSFYYHLKNAQMISNKQDWNEFFDSFQKGITPYKSCLDYMKAWESEIKNNKALDIEFFYFEELKTNGLECVRRLAKHLGINLKDTDLQEVLDVCSLKNLKEEADKNQSPAAKPLQNKDGKSVIFRKGEVADWKNHFTVAQNEMYDQKLNESMKDSMFEFKYE